MSNPFDEGDSDDDVFLPSKLKEEKHVLTASAGAKSKRGIRGPGKPSGGASKNTRCILCVFFSVCSAAVVAVLVAAAIAVAVEVVRLQKDKTAPTTAPPLQCPTPGPNDSLPTFPPPDGNSTDLVWWKTAIIYQCYPRSYQDTDADGSGDLAGIISRVDYLSELGVGAVWLNPIFRSPQKDNGYDISDYRDIDPLFGTLEQLRTLLSRLHAHGMRLLLDFVPNHTSDEHLWFVESRQNRTNPKRDWYVWADGSGENGTDPPNNWINFFGGSAWTYDEQTDQYYLHQFSSFQPDLNYWNPEVRQAFEDVLSFWLDLGVDGFRIDAVAYLLEDPALPDEPLNPDRSSDCNSSCYDYLTHTYTRNFAGIHEVIRGWRTVLDSYSNVSKRFMVGEVYESLETIASYYGQNSDEFHFPFNFFLLVNGEWTGTKVHSIVTSWLDTMPEGAWPNWVLGNHDNHRIASKASPYLARALNMLLLTLPGTPTTYYGEEILMTDVNVPPNRREDMYGDRDKERTPMQWDSGPNAGFTTATSVPWLPLADNYSQVNVEVERRDDTSILALYKKLARLRSSYAAFQNSNYQLVVNTTEVIAYIRYSSDTAQPRFLVVVNFAQHQVTVNINKKLGYQSCTQLYLSSFLNRTGLMDLSSLSLLGGEALIFVLD